MAGSQPVATPAPTDWTWGAGAEGFRWLRRHLRRRPVYVHRQREAAIRRPLGAARHAKLAAVRMASHSWEADTLSCGSGRDHYRGSSNVTS